MYLEGVPVFLCDGGGGCSGGDGGYGRDGEGGGDISNN